MGQRGVWAALIGFRRRGLEGYHPVRVRHMTASSFKRLVRDVQERTGWDYMFCRRIVKALGYEPVSDLIDRHIELGLTIDAAGRALNARMSGRKGAEGQ